MSFLNFLSGGEAFSGALVKLSGNYTNPGTTAIPWDAETYDTNAWHDNLTNKSRLTVPSGVAIARVIGSMNATLGSPSISTTKNGAVYRGRTLVKGGTSDVYSGGVSAPIAVSAADYFEMLTDLDVTAETRTWFAIEKLPSTTKYALVYRSTTLSLSASVAALVGWDSEVADTNGFHDPVTNNSRLTVPSGISCVKLGANIDTSSASGLVRMTIVKGGSAVAGGPFVNQERTATMPLNCVSAPMEVTPGDYFELSVLSSSARTLQSSEPVWFSIEEYPSTQARVLAQKSANQSYTSGIEAAIQWDGADIYDTNAMHDPASNNTRLTVPSGFTHAKVSFCVIGPSATGLQGVRVLKNAGTFEGMPSHQSEVNGAEALNASSGWVPVSPGDYFECMLTTGANLTLAARVDMWFCLECR